jgi:hypothetical protein
VKPRNGLFVKAADDAMKPSSHPSLHPSLHSSLAAALLAAMVLAADRVPELNVASYCRRVAHEAKPIGDERACLQEESDARAELARRWGQFPPRDRSYCVDLARLGGDPTFTELLTCLDMRREARRLREQRSGTTGASPRH